MSVISGFEDGARIVGATRAKGRGSRRFSEWLDAPWVAMVSPLTLLFVWWWVTETGHFSPQLLVSPATGRAGFFRPDGDG